MLIELFGSNFGCFRDEFRLSLEATRLDPENRRGIVELPVRGRRQPLRLLRCAAIYGPNASGKSTVLAAAEALRYVLTETHERMSSQPLLVYEPFLLGPSKGKPTTLGASAVIDGQRMTYCVSFDFDRITHERLTSVRGRASVDLFVRERDQVHGEWAADPHFALLKQGIRPNASFLGLADRFAQQLAKNIATQFDALLRVEHPEVHPWFEGGRIDRVAKLAMADNGFSEWLTSYLQAVDIGVVKFEVRETPRSSRSRAGDPGEASAGSAPTEPTRHRLVLLHQSGDGAKALPFHRESLGTRQFLQLAPLLHRLSFKAEPQATFLDEIDTSLHPTLIVSLIRHLNEHASPSARGQLIFTTHETALIDGEARNAPLRRDQVYFTEKDSDGAARLYSLAEFKERQNLNLRKRYLEGRFGALPSIGTIPCADDAEG